jgi:hypothetical protein
MKKNNNSKHVPEPQHEDDEVKKKKESPQETLTASLQMLKISHDDSQISKLMPIPIILLTWILLLLKRKLKSTIPYIAVTAVSVVLIATYTASRTIGVPIVGVESDIGSLDIASKVLQVIIIGMSLYLIFAIRKTMIKEQRMK